MFKNEKPFEIIMFGPPASGKGTQAKLLSETFKIPHISTGDLLRAIKLDKSNPLSQELSDLMDNGKLVSDELITKMVDGRIKEEDCKSGYILDGFPRTQDQVRALEQMSDIDYVFLVDVSDEAVIERIAGRRICKNAHTWHVKYNPTATEGICDTCGEALFIRDDDNEEKIKARLKVYHDNTDPIVELYESQGKLIQVNGEQHIEGVFQQIVQKMVDDLRKQIEVK
ncbi:MAG: adenylate kinase [Candidatus Buchananbacteria bacterium]